MNRLTSRPANCTSKCLMMFATVIVCFVAGCHPSLKARVEAEEVASAKASGDGDKTGAVDHLKAALVLDPDNVHTKYQLAWELKQAGRVPEAVAMFRIVAATKKPSDPDAEVWADASKQYLAKLAP